MDEMLDRVYARWGARSVLHLWDAPEVVRRWVDEGPEALREEALEHSCTSAGVTRNYRMLVEIDEDSPWEIVVCHKAAMASVYCSSLTKPVSPMWEMAEWAMETAGEALIESDETVVELRRAYRTAEEAVDEANEAVDEADEEEADRIWQGLPALEDAAQSAWSAVEDARSVISDLFYDRQERTRALLGVLPDLLRTHGLAARLLDDVRADPWLTREVVRALALPDLAVWVDWCKQMEAP